MFVPQLLERTQATSDPPVCVSSLVQVRRETACLRRIDPDEALA